MRTRQKRSASHKRNKTMTAQRNIVIVNSDAMLNDKLFRTMKYAPKSKVAAMLDSINLHGQARIDREATVQRRLAGGALVVQQSADIKHVEALMHNETFARFCVALRIDPQAYIDPASKDGGKLSTETSNLKAYKKAREIAETVYHGTSSLENVARVFSVCAFIAATKRDTLIERAFCNHFLRSNEFRSITQGTEEFMVAIDEMRARSLSSDSGAATQASQMIRTLVALKSAVDEMDGRAKNVRLDPNALVIQSLMRRFGQVTDVIEQSEEETNDITE